MLDDDDVDCIAAAADVAADDDDDDDVIFCRGVDVDDRLSLSLLLLLESLLKDIVFFLIKKRGFFLSWR